MGRTLDALTATNALPAPTHSCERGFSGMSLENEVIATYNDYQSNNLESEDPVVWELRVHSLVDEAAWRWDQNPSVMQPPEIDRSWGGGFFRHREDAVADAIAFATAHNQIKVEYRYSCPQVNGNDFWYSNEDIGEPGETIEQIVSDIRKQFEEECATSLSRADGFEPGFECTCEIEPSEGERQMLRYTLTYEDLRIVPPTRFYAVCDANGPISVALEGATEEQACAAFDKLDTQAVIDSASIDMEDFVGIENGESMSENDFAEVALLHGARRVKSLDEVHNYHAGTTAHLALGWTLWEVPNFTADEVEYFEPGEVFAEPGEGFARYQNYTDSEKQTPLECEVRLLTAEHEGISIWSYLVMSKALLMDHGVVFLTEEGARKAGEQYAKENHQVMLVYSATCAAVDGNVNWPGFDDEKLYGEPGQDEDELVEEIREMFEGQCKDLSPDDGYEPDHTCVCEIDKDGVRYKTLVYSLTHEDLFGCEADEDAAEPKPVVYLVETMPDHLLENGVVGNWGKYPTNGAWRGLVDDVSHIDGEGPARIVRIATAEDLKNYRRFKEQ